MLELEQKFLNVNVLERIFCIICFMPFPARGAASTDEIGKFSGFLMKSRDCAGSTIGPQKNAAQNTLQGRNAVFPSWHRVETGIPLGFAILAEAYRECGDGK